MEPLRGNYKPRPTAWVWEEMEPLRAEGSGQTAVLGFFREEAGLEKGGRQQAAASCRTPKLRMHASRKACFAGWHDRSRKALSQQCSDLSARNAVYGIETVNQGEAHTKRATENRRILKSCRRYSSGKPNRVECAG